MNPLWGAGLVLSLVTHVGLGQFAGSPDKTGQMHLSPVTKTVSLSQVKRSIGPEADLSRMKFDNGYLVGLTDNGEVQVLDEEGRTTARFLPHPAIAGFTGKLELLTVHDVAVVPDGSIVVSVVFMLPKDARRYFYLLTYDKEGNFVEQTDLGSWRANKICAAPDGSIWTLSGEERLGHAVYSPNEGVLRNYKSSAGLQKAVAPRSLFADDNRNSFMVNSAIDCSKGVHALTGDGEWLEYTSNGSLTILRMDDAEPGRADHSSKLRGFAYLGIGRVYGLLDDGSPDPTRRRFVELLPTADGLRLHWSEIVLPSASEALNGTLPVSEKQTPTITHLLGADHIEGERLVFLTSSGTEITWAHAVLELH